MAFDLRNYDYILMDSTVWNLLYQRPELYESVYDGADHAVPKMCERLFERNLGGPPSSILDLGCGTGRDLEYLVKHCADCIGVDCQAAMVDYARLRRSSIDFRVGDMRTLRLGRTFQVILCLGWAIANIHANEDLDQVMGTFAAHSEPGSLLVLQVINPDGIDGLPRRFTIDTPGFSADAAAEYLPHPREQLLERRRVWATSDGQQVHDVVQLRLLHPPELAYYLSNHGFDVLDIYDNTDLRPGELTGPSLYVVARYGRKEG